MEGIIFAVLLVSALMVTAGTYLHTTRKRPWVERPETIHWCQGCDRLVEQRWMEWEYGAWRCWNCIPGKKTSVPGTGGVCGELWKSVYAGTSRIEPLGEPGSGSRLINPLTPHPDFVSAETTHVWRGGAPVRLDDGRWYRERAK